jgi:hypothetical protein
MIDPRNPVYPNYPTGQPAYSQYPGQPPQQYQQPGMPVPGYAPTQPSMHPNVPPSAPVMPPIHVADEALVQSAYNQHKNDMVRGGGPQFLNFPGPQGQKRWDSTVHAGYECTVNVFLAPPWAEGVNIFAPSRSHFWKSQNKPQGQSIACPGSDVCLICRARETAISGSDEMVKQRAKDVGRVSSRFLYNVFALDNWQGHYDPTGAMRPFILQAGSMLHSAIGDIIEARGGAMAIVHPVYGRPLRLKKKKTGPRELDVEYSLVDLDPRPLPPEFFPALNNLWVLTDMSKTPTQADMANAVAEMGLPQPTGGPLTAVRPMVQPYINPYAQATMPQAAPNYPPAPQQYAANPPAVQSTGTPTHYAPQPSQPMPGLGQPVPSYPTGTNLPPPPNLAAPPMVAQAQGRADGRDRCFGKFTPTSNFCGECPPDLKPNCIVQSGQQAAKAPLTIEELQAQLQGR